MNKHIRAVGLVATAVAAGLIASIAVSGVANAEEAVTGEGSVTLDFSSTPGSVEVDVWTHNLSAIPAWGFAVVQDVDGAFYPFGPRAYAPGEEWSYSVTLPGYTCADLQGNANAYAFGFDAEPLTAADLADYEWTSGLIKYPDPRITVIGCAAPNPTGEEPEEPGEEPGEEPVVTPTDGGTTAPTVTTPTVTTPTATTPTATTPTAVNTLPAAKTDGAELAGEYTETPLFGLLFTLGAVLVSVVAAMAGPLRRR